MSLKKKMKEAPPIEKPTKNVRHAVDVIKENNEYIITIVAYNENGGNIVKKINLGNIRGIYILDKLYSVFRSKIMDEVDLPESLK